MYRFSQKQFLVPKLAHNIDDTIYEVPQLSLHSVMQLFNETKEISLTTQGDGLVSQCTDICNITELITDVQLFLFLLLKKYNVATSNSNGL
jgi:hypothetical protein